MGRRAYYTAKQLAVLEAIAVFFEDNEFGPRSTDIAEATGYCLSNIASTLFHLKLKGHVAYEPDTIGGRSGLRVTRLEHPDLGVWQETDEMRNVLVGS